MTRKDYVMLTNMLAKYHKVRKGEQKKVIVDLTVDLALALQGQSKSFKPATFLAAVFEGEKDGV